MASIRKLKSGKWQAQVAIKNQRKSKTFHSKLEAKNWANEMELEFQASDGYNFDGTFADLLDEYCQKVSSKKDGYRWEYIRIQAFKRHDLFSRKLKDVKTPDLAQWRDDRLKEVAGSTVAREMQILSHALKNATDEWHYIKSNPMVGMRRPKESPPRDRRITEEEIKRIIYIGEYETDIQLTTISQKVCGAFLFAIETAMRAGEIINLKWEYVNFDAKTAYLPKTKNGRPREVPLSTKAISILKQLPDNAISALR
jgi:integrase